MDNTRRYMPGIISARLLYPYSTLLTLLKGCARRGVDSFTLGAREDVTTVYKTAFFKSSVLKTLYIFYL